MLKEENSKEFREFFRKEMRNKMKNIEKERLEIKNKMKKARIISGVLFLLNLLFLGNEFLEKITYPLIFASVLFLFYSFMVPYSKNSIKLKEKMKSELIGGVIKSIDSQFIYKPNNFIDKNKFIDSNFHTENDIDSYSGENHISGTIDGAKFETSELNVRKVIRRVNEQDTYLNLFYGLYFIIDLDKDMEDGTVYAIPKSKGFFSDFNSGKFRITFNGIPNPYEEVRVGSNDFNKHYNFRATDKTFAKHFFTNELMEAMMYCKEDLGVNVSLSFSGGKMYIGLDTRRKYFELDFSRELNENELAFHYIELKKTLEIIRGLKMRIKQ